MASPSIQGFRTRAYAVLDSSATIRSVDMGNAQNKTVAGAGDVTAFLAAIPDETQRADAAAIAAMMARLSGQPPVLWGASIVGFDSYHYRYDSGREGDMPRIGFSPRKGNTVLYIIDGFNGYQGLLDRLGKHKTGKSCLYIKRLDQINMSVLEELCAASLAWMAKKYPKGLPASPVGTETA
jgi:hypothetical protein